MFDNSGLPDTASLDDDAKFQKYMPKGEAVSVLRDNFLRYTRVVARSKYRTINMPNPVIELAELRVSKRHALPSYMYPRNTTL